LETELYKKAREAENMSRDFYLEKAGEVRRISEMVRYIYPGKEIYPLWKSQGKR
jgi:hypothetical protein